MKKKHFLFASAMILLASCANDTISGDGEIWGGNSSQNAIAFNMSTSAQTRADDPSNKADADKLNDMFIVWGEKTSSDNSTETVFKNYKVVYDQTNYPTNSTVSNTKGWEYVGLTPYAATYVSPSILADNSSATQTIKYWDNNASKYTFTAVSAKAEDIQDNSNSSKVKIEKTQGENSAYQDGYTITVKSGASTGDIYFSDKNTIEKPTTIETAGSENKYNGYVQLAFRNFESKVRFGIFTNITAYKVVITGIKYTNSSSEVEHTTSTSGDDGKKFGITGNFIITGDNTTYDVTYDSNGKAQVALTDDNAFSSTYLQTAGTTWLSTSTTDAVSTSSATPTYDQSSNDSKGVYTNILPNPSNKSEMKLTISYDLYSVDTNEKISVGYKTVTVPAEYCQWKSNYAYTYLFKITDSSADLYPITFDAVVETNELGNQETITTVSEPSITTMGVKDNKIVSGKEEYEAGSTIYASVEEYNSTSKKYETVTLSTDNSNGNVKLYTVALADGVTNYEITEESVKQAIASTATTKKLTVTDVTTSSGASVTSDNDKVPDVDGTSRTISALKWTASSANTYAVEYTKEGKKTYKIVKVVAASQD